MSDDLSAAGNSTAFPPYTLHPPRMPELKQAEEQAANEYLRRIHAATMLYPPSQVETYRQRAADNLKTGFTYGWPSFDSWAQSSAGLPFLAWLSFRQTPANANMTLGEATQIIALANRDQRNAILEVWGYSVPKKPDAAPSMITPTGQSPTDSASQSPPAAAGLTAK